MDELRGLWRGKHDDIDSSRWMVGYLIKMWGKFCLQDPQCENHVVVLGDFEDRRRYEAALSAITEPDKREKFIAEWQDGRSSVNNIGKYCHKLAEELATHELL